MECTLDNIDECFSTVVKLSTDNQPVHRHYQCKREKKQINGVCVPILHTTYRAPVCEYMLNDEQRPLFQLVFDQHKNIFERWTQHVSIRTVTQERRQPLPSLLILMFCRIACTLVQNFLTHLTNRMVPVYVSIVIGWFSAYKELLQTVHSRKEYRETVIAPWSALQKLLYAMENACRLVQVICINCTDVHLPNAIDTLHHFFSTGTFTVDDVVTYKEFVIQQYGLAHGYLYGYFRTRNTIQIMHCNASTTLLMTVLGMLFPKKSLSTYMSKGHIQVLCIDEDERCYLIKSIMFSNHDRENGVRGARTYQELQRGTVEAILFHTHVPSTLRSLIHQAGEDATLDILHYLPVDGKLERIILPFKDVLIFVDGMMDIVIDLKDIVNPCLDSIKTCVSHLEG